MPAPVAAASQCLTDEAARALDDAVAVARRRSHAQTTSLHALSALLALPSSVLRSTCSRLAAAGSRPPRLQLKALELSVGVSLDRLPTSRSGAGEEDGGGPPLSNSLMAAIRRSQANQRRQPESFYTYSNTASVLKVELKHFIVSILDDPIISRVFWEAGFRSCDIKLALLNPPISPHRRGPIRPPMFLCNFPGYDVDRFGLGKEDGDESFRRIVNVLLGKDGKGRNPLLVGSSSHDVVDRFVSVVSGSGGNREVLLGELVGVGVASLGEVVGDKERMRLKFEEIYSELEGGTWIGLIVNYGELKGLVAEEDDDGAGNCLVSGLRGLVERYQGKVWLIGAATSNEAVSHLVKRFPDIERDLDLHVLPVASSSNRFVYSPTSQSSFEQEVDAMTKAGMKVPVADRQAQNIPSWLQMADVEASSSKDLTQTVDEGTMNAEILGLERKWTDTCRRLHHPQQFSLSDALSVGSPVNVTQDVGFSLEKVKPGWIMDSLPNDHQCKELTPGVVIDSTFQPSRSTALNLRTECLVKVYLPGSKDALVQDLVNLKQLDLSCSNFTRIPDLSRARKLQSLDLHSCNNLVDVSFIQFLTKLEYINLKGCTSLTRLPSLMALKFLLSLDVSDCINLSRLPPSLGCLSSLAALDLSNCKRIQNLPKGILRLKSVQTLSISGCSMLMEQASGPDGMLVENQVNPRAHSSSHGSDDQTLSISGCSMLMERASGPDRMLNENQVNPRAHSCPHALDEEVSMSYIPVDKYVPTIPLQQPEEERIIRKYNSVVSKGAAEPSSTTADLELHKQVLKAYMNMPVEKIHQANAFYDVQRTADSLIGLSPNLHGSESLHDLTYYLEELQENVPETMLRMDDARVSKASIQVKLAHLLSSFVQSEGHYNGLAARLSVISDEEEDLDAEIDRLLAKRRELLD